MIRESAEYQLVAEIALTSKDQEDRQTRRGEMQCRRSDYLRGHTSTLEPVDIMCRDASISKRLGLSRALLK